MQHVRRPSLSSATPKPDPTENTTKPDKGTTGGGNTGDRYKQEEATAPRATVNWRETVPRERGPYADPDITAEQMQRSAMLRHQLEQLGERGLPPDHVRDMQEMLLEEAELPGRLHLELYGDGEPMSPLEFNNLIDELSRVSNADSSLTPAPGCTIAGSLSVRFVRSQRISEEKKLLTYIYLDPAAQDVNQVAFFANKVNEEEGYGNACRFDADVHGTYIELQLQLDKSMTAEELWDHISHTAQYGRELWDNATTHLATMERPAGY